MICPSCGAITRLLNQQRSQTRRPNQCSFVHRVMQACFSKLQLRWQRLDERRTGVKYGIEFPRGQLTNLRFADDVILVAQQRADVRKMLQDLKETSSKYGLKIHLGKTKVMTWNALVSGSHHVALATIWSRSLMKPTQRGILAEPFVSPRVRRLSLTIALRLAGPLFTSI